MMEYQVKFCHHSGPRLWRTRMLFSTKSKGHKSNVHISWMYRYRFYDLKVHFWWPNKRLFSYIQRWNTLYLDGDGGTGGGRLGNCPANPPYILAEIQAKRDISKDLVLGLAPTPQICQPSEASDQYREAVNEKAKWNLWPFSKVTCISDLFKQKQSQPPKCCKMLPFLLIFSLLYAIE